jgi:hypothetical protein
VIKWKTYLSWCLVFWRVYFQVPPLTLHGPKFSFNILIKIHIRYAIIQASV